MQSKVSHYFLLITRSYAQVLHALLALSPMVLIVYLIQYQNPELRYESHHFHEIAIAGAILLSLFITYVTWLCYRSSGEVLLRWLTLAFLGFAVIYAPHGIFTSLAHHAPALFLLYGPVSRVVMNALLCVAIMQQGRDSDSEMQRSSKGFWFGWLGGFLFIDILVAVIALSDFDTVMPVRIIFEGMALVFAITCVAIMLWRRTRLPLLIFYAMAMVMFAQSSLAFLYATAWNHLWWLAHAISAAGFMLLSYGVVRAFHTTRSFSTVYSIEEVMRQLEEANRKLLHVATTDALTGVANRRKFFSSLETELARSQRSCRPFSLMIADLDHFKAINDSYGHPVGDEVLRQITKTIEGMLRTTDMIGRIGGEEFAILLPETGPQEAIGIGQRLCREVADIRIHSQGEPVTVTVSLGVASFPDDGDSIKKLYGTADHHLYSAKQAGRNRCFPILA